MLFCDNCVLFLIWSWNVLSFHQFKHQFSRSFSEFACSPHVFIGFSFLSVLQLHATVQRIVMLLPCRLITLSLLSEEWALIDKGTVICKSLGKWHTERASNVDSSEAKWQVFLWRQQTEEVAKANREISRNKQAVKHSDKWIKIWARKLNDIDNVIKRQMLAEEYKYWVSWLTRHCCSSPVHQ